MILLSCIKNEIEVKKIKFYRTNGFNEPFRDLETGVLDEGERF